jgi:hypothetical protein
VVSVEKFWETPLVSSPWRETIVAVRAFILNRAVSTLDKNLRVSVVATHLCGPLNGVFFAVEIPGRA